MFTQSVCDETVTVIMLIYLLKKKNKEKMKANTELNQTKIVLKMCVRKMMTTRLINDFWKEPMSQPSVVQWIL